MFVETILGFDKHFLRKHQQKRGEQVILEAQIEGIEWQGLEIFQAGIVRKNI